MQSVPYMVPQNMVATQLERHGFDSWTVRWIRNWLAGCVQRVTLNGSTSKWKPVMCGVPQGPVLGPGLFSIFIHDRVSGIECTLCKLVGAVDSLEGRDAIQRDHDSLEDWTVRTS